MKNWICQALRGLFQRRVGLAGLLLPDSCHGSSKIRGVPKLIHKRIFDWLRHDGFAQLLLIADADDEIGIDPDCHKLSFAHDRGLVNNLLIEMDSLCPFDEAVNYPDHSVVVGMIDQGRPVELGSRNTVWNVGDDVLRSFTVVSEDPYRKGNLAYGCPYLVVYFDIVGVLEAFAVVELLPRKRGVRRTSHGKSGNGADACPSNAPITSLPTTR